MHPRMGRYHVLAELGRGGMSRVYLSTVAGPAGFHKLAVLKVLLNELVTEDPSFVRMFLDEATLAARLNHTNIVQTNEVGCENERYFIAMEYLEGQPLHRVLRRALHRGERFALPLFLRVIAEALEGLHAAHSAKDFDGSPLHIVHRDASPQNIFLTYNGQVKVMDFGIAKARGRAGEATRLGVLKGKVVYMAPEQVDGRTVDHRADVFGIGVVLFDYLAKRRMYEGCAEVEVVARLMRREYDRSPMMVNPEVPSELDAICQRALSPEPDDRYPDARAMCDDLRAYLRTTLPTERELGDAVSNLFAQERVDIAAVVEKQLRAVQERALAETEDNIPREPPPLPRLQSFVQETLTPASVTASKELPVAAASRRNRRTLAIALPSLALGVGLTMLLTHRPPPPLAAPAMAATLAADTRPTAPVASVTAPVVAVAPPIEVAAPVPVASEKPRSAAVAPMPVFQPRVIPRPSPVAPPPTPRTAAPEAAPPTAAAPVTPAPPRSTKPDLGY